MALLSRYRLPLSALLVFSLITLWLSTSTSESASSFRLQLKPYIPSRLSSVKGATIIPNAKTYVITLARRTDRQADMEKLRTDLGLREWEFVHAVDTSWHLIDERMEYVEWAREKAMSGPEPYFEWHEDDIRRRALSSAYLSIPTYDFHPSPTIKHNENDLLTCTTEDFTIHQPDESDLPEWLELTRARVACWSSHLNVIQRLANELQPGEAGIILEDDVDMERDVKAEVGSLWGGVSEDWDMLFLGHCWSDESHHNSTAFQPAGQRLQHTLYKSFAPKCAHAYALSRTGARKLFLYLTHPLFAYSRAVDQAYEWLIATERLKSYSVVPSIAVQRKIGSSDISNAKEIYWKDGLYDGVLDGHTMPEDTD